MLRLASADMRSGLVDPAEAPDVFRRSSGEIRTRAVWEVRRGSICRTIGETVPRGCMQVGSGALPIPLLDHSQVRDGSQGKRGPGGIVQYVNPSPSACIGALGLGTGSDAGGL